MKRVAPHLKSSPGKGTSVLLVDLSRTFTGTEARVLEIARALHGCIPYAVAVLEGSPLCERLTDAGLSAIALPLSKYDPRLVPALMRVVRDRGFNVVDAHNTQSQLWGLLAASRAGVPVRISTVHASYRALYRGWKGWAHHLILRWNIRWRCYFVAVSKSVHAYLRQLGVREEDLRLIYNGIRLSEWQAPDPGPSYRRALGWGRDDFVVITVANLEPVKGHRYLIEAMSRVIEERPRTRCLFVGDGSSRQALEAMVRRRKMEPYIHFAGFRTDVRRMLFSADAFCLPSVLEALPIAILEACACRLPLLATSVGDMPELFSHGRSAFLVPPGDARALTEGLVYLRDHPEERFRMADEAHAVVRRTLSPETMIDRTLELYRGDLRKKT